MTQKPTYEELEQKIKDLEKEAGKRNVAEKALKESKALLKKSQEIAHIGSWRLDLEKDELYWSDEVYRIFGLAPQEFGATYEAFLQAVHPDDRDMVDQTYNNAVQNQQPYEITHRILRPDGSIRIVREKSEDIVDESGKTIISIGMVHDITESVHAEMALRESEEKYRNLVERANDGVSIIQNGIVKFVNSRLAEIFGFTVEKMIDTSFLDYVFPDERSRIADIHKRRLQGEDVPEIYEMVGLHKDGRRIDLEINSGVITYQGEPAVFGFVRDITNRKRAEIDRLEKERLQGVVELAGAVCHELSQPLQAVSGMSDLMMMNVDGDSQICEDVQTIKKKVHKMAEITRKLMSITQYKTKDYLKRKIIDIDKASEQVEKK
ncbi:PAS domain S-box protein [Thermodesulfobacteriota bacterium]